MVAAFVIAATLPLVATSPALARAGDDWRIVRYDAREFCATTTLTWDLKRGRLSIAEGGCGPHSAAPPTVTSKPIRPYDLALLRILSSRVEAEGMAQTSCRSVPVHPLPGPLYFVVTKGGREIRSPNCLNALGVRLDDALTASLKP
ncbi:MULTISPECIES: hypothetical protein [Bacteria]|uniref:hypothetical protein n=1 Tax=Bacteria TaxID=2 RepID=UPI00105720F4|nr:MULTISPECIES: hypothetical protein [Bacteria]